MKPTKEQLLKQILELNAAAGGPPPQKRDDVPRWRNGEPKDKLLALKERIAKLEDEIDPERCFSGDDPEWALAHNEQFGKLLRLRERHDKELRSREQQQADEARRASVDAYDQRKADALAGRRAIAEKRHQQAVDDWYATGGKSEPVKQLEAYMPPEKPAGGAA